MQTLRPGEKAEFINNALNPDLPEHRQKIIEYGIAATQQVAQERDDALAQVEDLTKKLAAMKVEVESLQAMSSAQESRAQSHQNERDEAVAKRAEYEVLLRSIQAQMREFGIQHEPLVRAAEDPDYTVARTGQD